MGRSAYDFERYAYQDLRKYLKSFELPKPLDCDPREILLMLARPDPPFMGHVKRLTITNEPWRILENIRPLALKEALVLTWLNSSIPVEPVHKIDMQDPPYTLPQILSDKFFSYKRSDAEEMKSWLMLPVVTATRVMHTAFPQTTGWVFKAEEEETADSSWFQCARWTPRVHNPGPEEQPVPVRLVMAFQTPFVLNEQDMHAFSACTAFPPYNMGPTNGLPSKYRLWAKIWDTCYSNNCRWFVLTSYTQWVFGVFSKTMRTAFLSSIYKYDSTSPTILELLTYWIASSMGMPGAFRPVQVEEPIFTETPVGMDVINARLSKRGKTLRSEILPKALRSEAAWWPGCDDEPPEEAGVDLESVFAGEGSLHSYYPVQNKMDINRPEFKKWIAKSSKAKYRKLDEDDFNPNPIPEFEFPENAFNPNIARGEWML